MNNINSDIENAEIKTVEVVTAESSAANSNKPVAVDSDTYTSGKNDSKDTTEAEISELVNQNPIEEKLKKLRIVIVSDAAPQRNGVGSYYHDLERYLQGKVEHIETICPIIEGKRWSGGLNFSLPGDNTQKFVVPNFWKLKKQITAIRPDIVITPTPGAFGMFGSIIGKQLDAKVIIGFHTWFEKLADLYWNPVQSWLIKKYFWVSNWILFKFGDCVLANSDHMIQVAKQLGARKTGIMGTPISFDFTHAPTKKVHTPPRNVLFAGRLSAEKNIQSVIDAARKHSAIEFSISGDGPDREQVLSACKELPNLKFLGWLSREELLEQMDNHDIVVLPSIVESFGTIALESLVRKRITLVSDACGIIEWPDMDKGLFIYSNEDTLSVALERLFDTDEHEIQNKIMHGHKSALSINDWNFNTWCDVLLSK